MEKEKLILLDAGHGGLVEGRYVTSGKRSPVLSPEDSGVAKPVVLFEGVVNRAIAFDVQLQLSAMGIKSEILAPENTDISLWTRVKRAKELHERFNCFGVSIHFNAVDPPDKFSKPYGAEIWTSLGETKSDEYAEFFFHEYEKTFAGYKYCKWRKGVAGQVDKESKFYILTKTPMPFVLTETAFMTHLETVKDLFSMEHRKLIVDYHVQAIASVYDKM